MQARLLATSLSWVASLQASIGSVVRTPSTTWLDQYAFTDWHRASEVMSLLWSGLATVIDCMLIENCICYCISADKRYTSPLSTDQQRSDSFNMLHKVDVTLVRQERTPGSLQLIKRF